MAKSILLASSFKSLKKLRKKVQRRLDKRGIVWLRLDLAEPTIDGAFWETILRYAQKSLIPSSSIRVYHQLTTSLYRIFPPNGSLSEGRRLRYSVPSENPLSKVHPLDNVKESTLFCIIQSPGPRLIVEDGEATIEVSATN